MSHRDDGSTTDDTVEGEIAETDPGSKDDPTGGFSRRNYLKGAGIAAAGLAIGVGTASAATTRYGIDFDRVVHAVDDLGLDPTGGKSIGNAIENAASNGTLIEFPDGEFLVTGNVSVSGLNRFGIVGSGNTRLVAPGGRKIAIVYKNIDDGLFADLTLDQTRTQADFVTKFLTPTYNHIENVDVVGFNEPMDDVKIGFKIVPQATDSGGEILVKNFRAADGGPLGSYIGGGGGMYLGPGHRGTARIVDCHLEEWANNGIYAGRANGPVQVTGGVYRNNDVSQVRLSGPDSWVRGAEIEVDMSKSDNPGSPRNQRGVLIETGKIQKTGGGVYDCDIRYNVAPTASNAIFVHGNAGYAEIENTRIEINRDGARALRAATPQATNGGRRPPAPKPHHVKLRNVSVTGSASRNEAIKISDRPGSEVVNCCIHQTGSDRDGVKLIDSDNCVVRDSTIDVTRRETVFVRSQVDTSNVTTSGTCPAPGAAPEPEPEPTPDPEPEPDPETVPLVVEKAAADDERIEYEIAVEGDLEPTETVDAHETFTDSGVEGIIRDGVDEYALDGAITDISATGEIDVTVDGETVDLSQFDDTRSLVVAPATADGTEISYTFAVDGTIATTDTVDAHEEVGDGTVTGKVINGIDGFEITGSLTDFQADGELDVTLDGEAVDLSQFGPDVKALHLETDSSEKVNYSLTVEGDLEPTETVDAHEVIEGNTVTGIIRQGGVDDYEFTGALTDVQADGPLTVTVDGEAVDLSQFEPEPLPNTLVVDGTGTNSKTTYTFSVSGNVEKDPEVGSINEGDVIDGQTVTGEVYNGIDGYRFDGDITAFELNGTADVRFDDNDG